MERKVKTLTKAQKKACEKILSSHPLFSCFPQETRDFLVGHFTQQTYQKGEKIVVEGEQVDSIYLIQKGSAEVRKAVVSDPKKKTDAPIAVLNPGEFIGLNERGLYSKTGKRSATIVALSRMVLFRLSLEVLNTFLEEHPAFSEALTDNVLLSKVDFIKQAAPFGKLSAESLYAFAKSVEEIYVPAGHILFKKGDEAESCYLICSGKIEIVLKESEKEEKHSLAELTSPAIFGETAILMNAPRNASALVLEDANLLVISKALLLEIMGKEEGTAESLMNLVALRSRPVRNRNIEYYHTRTPDGEEEITLKDTAHARYFRLSSRGWFIWEQLDGKKSLRDITMAYLEAFQVFNPKLVADIVWDLDQAGFVTTHEGSKSETSPQKIGWKWRFFLAVRRVLEFRVPLKGVDEWVTKTYQQWIHFLYHPITWFIFIALSLIGFGIFCANFGYAIELIGKVGKGKWWLLLLSIPCMMVVAALHELAHAYTTKFFGKKVLAFGLGWFWIGPIAFCDTSDMWLSKPYQRVMVDLAGIFLHFVVGGAFAITSVWIGNPYWGLFCWYIALLNYLMIFENLKPIIELDGYYALMDGLNRPHLKLDAVEWIAGWPRTFSQYKLYKAEVIYWLTCAVYLVLEFILPFVVLRYLLKGFFGISNPLWSLLVSILVVTFSALAVWAEIKQNQLEKKRGGRSINS